MNTTDAKEFKQDVMDGYNAMMKPLYVKYNRYNNIQIKLELLSILTSHILSAAKDNCRKGKHRKLKFAQLKAEVKQYRSEGRELKMDAELKCF